MKPTKPKIAARIMFRFFASELELSRADSVLSTITLNYLAS